MGFRQAIGACFRKYAVFGGRARRAEYWWFVLFSTGLFAAAALLEQFALRGGDPVSSLVLLALFLPQLAVTVRRLHDTGRSGWWLGGYIVYLFAAVMLSVMAVFGPAGRGPTGREGEIVPAVLLGGAALFGVWLFVLTVLRGTDGANKYGADPAGV
jgi:uncharacterized membrane protein YhaH (DUF805 family)